MNRRILLLAASVSCWATVVVPASAQHFEQIPGYLTQVAAGRAEVWGVAPNGVYRFNASKGKFVKVAGMLQAVAVGGGSLLQTDAVWGLAQGGGVFQFDFTTGTLVQMQAPLLITQITVGDGYTDNCHPYEVWGIVFTNQEQHTLVRFNYCTSVFDSIPGSLTSISTGGGDVWGINSSGQIFQYNFVNQTWVQIGGTLQQIAVGVNDVWGLDGLGRVYRYEGSAGFVLIDAAPFSQIVEGGDGVWGLTPSIWVNGTNTIVRFDPNVEIAVAVPGSLTQIAVGYGAGVWGLTAGTEVYSFVRP